MLRPLGLVMVGFAFAFACGVPPGSGMEDGGDSGTDADGGTESDAGTVDGGGGDAGRPRDAGLDSGVDAGRDGGSSKSDAGPDSGAPADSGIGPDGGCVFDGGSCEAETVRRRDAIFAAHVNSPFPPLTPATCWADATWAFAAVWSNTDLVNANAKLAAIPSTYVVVADPLNDGDCYWANSLFSRLLLTPNLAARLTPAATSALRNIALTYISQRSRLVDANGSVWTISGSENHDAQRKSSYLLFSLALVAAGQAGTVLADGKTVLQHKQAWTAHWKEYFRQRAREGVSVEIASPTYGKYSMQAYYNVRDLSDDAVLRRLGTDFLTLYWADYAQDFLPDTGVRGGAATRMYKDTSMTLARSDDLRVATWMYLWQSAAPVPANSNPALLAALASSYRPPPVVTAMATRATTHTYVSRRFGLAAQISDPQGIAYSVAFPGGNSNLRRHTYWTPDYVLGALSLNPSLKYAALNEQNRAMGVMFSSGLNHRIIVAGRGTDQGGRRGYTEIHGASSRGCLVVARDPSARLSDGTRIFVASGPLLSNQKTVGTWWFSRAGNAFVAIHLATGNWSIKADPAGVFFDLGDMWAPIVIQMGLGSDFADFAAFQTAVTGRPVTYAGGKLTYQSLAGDTFEIWSNSKTVPTLNGSSVELNPTLTYDSPYLSGMHGTNTVQLTFPGEAPLTLDFSFP